METARLIKYFFQSDQIEHKDGRGYDYIQKHTVVVMTQASKDKHTFDKDQLFLTKDTTRNWTDERDGHTFDIQQRWTYARTGRAKHIMSMVSLEWLETATETETVRVRIDDYADVGVDDDDEGTDGYVFTESDDEEWERFILREDVNNEMYEGDGVNESNTDGDDWNEEYVFTESDDEEWDRFVLSENMKNVRQEGDDVEGDNESNTESDVDDWNDEYVFTESDDEEWDRFVLSENMKNEMDERNSEGFAGKNVDDNENHFVRLCC